MRLKVITRALLLGATRLATTPQPFRKAKPSEREHLRQGFEHEFWDNFNAVLWSVISSGYSTVNAGASVSTATLLVGCPVACRLEWDVIVEYTYTATAAKTIDLHLKIDGVDIPGSPLRVRIGAVTGGWQGPIALGGGIDVAKGVHSLVATITNVAGADSIQVFSRTNKVRRARKPPP